MIPLQTPMLASSDAGLLEALAEMETSGAPVRGTVYLAHFEPAFGHARHYLGWTSLDVDARFTRHLAGRGSALMRAAYEAGCKITIVRTWPNVTRYFERGLKESKNTPRLCPRCSRSGGG